MPHARNRSAVKKYGSVCLLQTPPGRCVDGGLPWQRGQHVALIEARAADHVDLYRGISQPVCVNCEWRLTTSLVKSAVHSVKKTTCLHLGAISDLTPHKRTGLTLYRWGDPWAFLGALRSHGVGLFKPIYMNLVWQQNGLCIHGHDLEPWKVGLPMYPKLS